MALLVEKMMKHDDRHWRPSFFWGDKFWFDKAARRWWVKHLQAMEIRQKHRESLDCKASDLPTQRWKPLSDSVVGESPGNLCWTSWTTSSNAWFSCAPAVGWPPFRGNDANTGLRGNYLYDPVRMVSICWIFWGIKLCDVWNTAVGRTITRNRAEAKT